MSTPHQRSLTTITKFDLYRFSVQDPPRMAKFIRAIATNPKSKTLREDFAGPAALACQWVTMHPSHRAKAIDLDPLPLSHAPVSLYNTRNTRCQLISENALQTNHRADIIAALNFAVCELHTRANLIKYFKNARRTLKRHGTLIFDLYGGSSAYKPQRVTTHAYTQPPFPKKKITYTWHQVRATQRTAMVENHLHFAIGSRTWPSAFIYNWRLWTIPEITESLHAAGFRTIDTYDKMGDALDSDGNLYCTPMSEHDTLDRNWVIYIAARKQ